MDNAYTITLDPRGTQTGVRVEGPAGRWEAATVYHASAFQDRPQVGWASIGAKDPSVAEAVAEAILTAAKIAASETI